MSHFTSVKTKITSLVNLIAALQDLELEYEEAQEGQLVKVRGYRGNEELAELVIKVSENYDIGVRKTVTGEYELVADWNELQDLVDTESIIEKVTQRYAYHTVMEQIQRQGFTLDETETQEDGSIRIRVSTWR